MIRHPKFYSQSGLVALTTCFIVLIAIILPYSAQSQQTARTNRVWFADRASYTRQAEPTNGDDGIPKNATYYVDAYDLSICGLVNPNWWQKEQSAFRCKAPNLNRSEQLLGQRRAQSRIVDGTLANEGGFPYHVTLSLTNRSNTYICGGTLIHNDLVLTSAYCFEDMHRVVASLGDNKVEKSTTKIEASYWCHHLETGEKEGLNLAIIQLEKPVTYLPNKIWPVCMIKGWKKPIQPTICSAVGMGQINNEGTTASELMSLPVRRRCFDYPPTIPRNKFAHCYVADSNGTVCQGDGGSPVVCYDKCGTSETRAFAVGTISGNQNKACRPGQELASIKVSEFHDAVYVLTDAVRKVSKAKHVKCRYPKQTPT